MQKKTKKFLIIIVSVILAVFIAALCINHALKVSAINKVSANLSGKTFSDVRYIYDVELYDPVNDRHYSFYAVESTFEFHEDGTLTWTRQYDRSLNRNKLTEPVATTEKYEVVYLGNFWYSYTGLNLKLESGDILDFRFTGNESRSALNPTEVNVALRYDENLTAPEALMHIDTSYISTSKKTTSSKNNSSSVCSRCSGTGRVTKHFGNSWNKKPGYGYGDVCGACGGSGKA